MFDRKKVMLSPVDCQGVEVGLRPMGCIHQILEEAAEKRSKK